MDDKGFLLQEYKIFKQDSDGVQRIIGSTYFDQAVTLVKVLPPVPTPIPVQITRPTRLESDTVPPTKKARVFQAQEYEESDLYIRDPYSRGKVVRTTTERDVLKEVFEITEEEFGDFIYQGPELKFKFMKVVKCQDYPPYIVITTFEHNLTYQGQHPSWKLYTFSHSLNDRIIYRTNKHLSDKIHFRISNVEVPEIGSFTEAINRNRGSCYSVSALFARTGLDPETSDEEGDI